MTCFVLKFKKKKKKKKKKKNQKIKISPAANVIGALKVIVLSASLGKTFLRWRFLLNENILFWLTILCQKTVAFYVSVFCSQIFTQKLKLRQKVGLAYAISIVK